MNSWPDRAPTGNWSNDFLKQKVPVFAYLLTFTLCSCSVKFHVDCPYQESDDSGNAISNIAIVPR